MAQPPTWGTPPPPQPGGWPNHPVPGRPGQPAQGGQWGPQQPWTTPNQVPPPAPVPPKRGGAGKWVIGAVALVAVIAVTAVIAVYLTKSSSGGAATAGDGAATAGAPSDVASANDTGPVGIITEDPSCAPWGPITSTLANIEAKGWKDRDPAIPAWSWTPQARAQYDEVGAAWRMAADQSVPLAKMTTHRVMRELYEVSIASLRAYADSLPTYVPRDDSLAHTATTVGLVISHVCDAIKSGAAAARAALVPKPAAPKSVAPIGDLANPKPVFETPDPVCANLSPTLQLLLQNPDFKTWTNTDPQIPASNWSAEQKSLTNAVLPVMSSTATAIEKLAGQTTNPIVQDLLLLGVQYRRTYVATAPTYQPNDHDIYMAGQMAPGVVAMACRYAAG